MKNSPDMLDNGSGAEGRFAGQAARRGSQRRDGLGLPEQNRDGLGLPEQDRDGSSLAERSPEGDLGPRNGPAPSLDDGATMPTMLEPPPVLAPSMSLNDLDSLSAPVFPPAGWLGDSPTGTLADHPLLRGLLLELPPKGTVPQPGWLDRWFEAARSILELLYMQPSGQVNRR